MIGTGHSAPGFDSEGELEEALCRPRPELAESIKQIRSPLLVLGAGGKMGPTLCVLAHRAAQQAGHRLQVLAASRFSDPEKKHWLETRGVTCIPCDLLDRSQVQQLPTAQDIIYLVGLKFGTARNPARTWAINTLVPSYIAEQFPSARIVALSTGNVYPFSPASSGGSLESDPLIPLGEYGNAAVARERIFEFYSQARNTQITLLRLFYAIDLRYGVLRDLADNICADRPISLANGRFNCIWQGDANEFILRSFGLVASPPQVLNLSRPEIVSVRQAAEGLGRLLEKPVRFVGEEKETALLGNTSRMCGLLGPPPTSVADMITWTARWVKNGGKSLNKPTHFETRDGAY